MTVWSTIVEGEVSGDAVTGTTLPPCTSAVFMVAVACRGAGAVHTTTDVLIGVVFVVSAGDTTIPNFRYAYGSSQSLVESEVTIALWLLYSCKSAMCSVDVVTGPAVCLIIVVTASFFLFLIGSDNVHQTT